MGTKRASISNARDAGLWFETPKVENLKSSRKGQEDNRPPGAPSNAARSEIGPYRARVQPRVPACAGRCQVTALHID